MGTITERKRNDGSSAFTAQIRLKRDGQTHTEAKTFDRKKEAEVWLIRREGELAKGIPDTTIKSIRELISDYATTYDGPKNSCFRSLMNLIATNVETGQPRYAFADTNAITIKTAEVLDWIKIRTKEVKPATVKFDLAQLRGILVSAKTEHGLNIPIDQFEAAVSYASKKGWCAASQRRERRINDDELNQILHHFTTRHGTIPMHDITLFALHSCRRLEEIMRLRWDDYDPQKKIILVRDIKHPKKKEGNNCYARLTDEAMAIIDRQPKGNERIFPYLHKSVGRCFYNVVRLLGINDLHFHDLRHEGVTRLFEKGYAIHEVALFSLHRDWTTLQRYTHLRAENVRDIK